MKITTLVLMLFVCVSCSTSKLENSTSTASAGVTTQNLDFIGEWIRGVHSSEGHYNERLIVNTKHYKYFEDGKLVMTGPTVVKDSKILINPKVNNSRYYRNLGGCWGRLRNNNMSLDLFGNVKGLLCFDRSTGTEQ